ncbi:DUF1801 domain-containing protein [Pedobacter sp. MR2016-24]|uniref:DUF1801 domain-containing protein n=1 Tax=Pedobacter sp. MR2016-24 TaxID=2994466 RepID=UPI0022450CF0|nr:DUF1801 domain-containing protein [Pedobacter sp. MR2016-24]MCX2485822.1 DUF1801 domain-containing protein [Pedobacter sp. MR2016-24]
MSREKIADQDLVTELIKNLSPDFMEIITSLREVILSADEHISEHVKWNSPAFYYNGPMQPFNPKEYSRDIAVIHVRKANILIVFPTGAKVEDTTGLLQGNYTDGRRIATFKDLDDVHAKAEDLKKVIRQWLSLVNK